MQKIKTKINNCNMSILHKITTKLKKRETIEIKIIFFLKAIYLYPNVVYQGKVPSFQPIYKENIGRKLFP